MNPHTPPGQPADPAYRGGPAPYPGGYGSPIPAGYGQGAPVEESLTPAVDPWPSAPVLPMGYYSSDPDQSSMDILAHSAPPDAGDGTPGGPRRRLKVLLAAGAAVVVLAGVAVAVAVLVNGGGTDRTGTGTGVHTAAWQALTAAPQPFEGAGVAAWGPSPDGPTKLWVIGGVSARTDRHLMADTQLYDPATDTWSVGPALPEGRAFASVVVAGTDLYVIGGQVKSGATATVLHLTADGTGWEAGPSLPEARETGAAVWDGQRVVFAGGRGTDGAGHADIYVLAGGAWTRLPATLQVAREKLSGATDHFGTVWFMGGRDPKANKPMPYVDVVHDDNTVDKISALAVPVHSGAGLVIPGIGACVLGGETDKGKSAGASCLDQAKNKLVSAMPKARAGLGTDLIDKTVYVVGGYGDGLDGSGDLAKLPAPTG